MRAAGNTNREIGEAQARVALAAAIMPIDETCDLPGRHNLFEQAAVGRATDTYAQALTNLIRGDE
ncbi:hypothetical protein [Propionicicella superfundia]|uniref:hypothetical protein n=1 Tax=Propionicicella superfundia TaxID=348582 RepID=UPI0003F90865|nr:hypothetical protein [Propionicicella superfundia]